VGDAFDAHILRVRGLHLILLERLHLDNAMLGWATNMAMLGVDISGHFNSLGVVGWEQDVRGGNEKTYRVGHDDPLRYRVKKETLTGMGDGPFYLVHRRTWWLMLALW